MLVSELMETDLNKYIEKHKAPSLYQCMSLAHKIATGMSWIDGVVIHTGRVWKFLAFFKQQNPCFCRFEAFKHFAWKSGGWPVDEQGSSWKF